MPKEKDRQENKEKMKEQMEKQEKKVEEKEPAVSNCNDKKCPFHGNLKTRGRTFKGYVTRIGHKKVVIEFERFLYLQKYERYEKRRTRIHAHLPDCMASQIKLGDYVIVRECRPLSKMIHHVLVSKVSKTKSAELGEK